MTERIRERLDCGVLVYSYLDAVDLAVKRQIEQAFLFAVIHVFNQSESLVQVVGNSGFRINPLSVPLDIKVISARRKSVSVCRERDLAILSQNPD